MHLSSTTQLIPPQSLKLSTGFRSKNIFVFLCNLIRYFAHYARKKEFNVTWKFSHTQNRSFFTTEVGILFPRPWQFWDFLLTHNGQKMCETLAELIWSSRAQSFFLQKTRKGAFAWQQHYFYYYYYLHCTWAWSSGQRVLLWKKKFSNLALILYHTWF